MTKKEIEKGERKKIVSGGVSRVTAKGSPTGLHDGTKRQRGQVSNTLLAAAATYHQ